MTTTRGPGPETKLSHLVQASLGILYGSKCFVWKFHATEYDPPGIPDLIGHIDGKFLGLELKANGSYPSAAQLATIRGLDRKGAACGIILSTKDGDYYFVPPYALEVAGGLSYRNKSGWVKLSLGNYPHPDGGSVPYLHLKPALKLVLED